MSGRKPPSRYRRQGRPNVAEGMNVLRCDIEDVSEAIKLRMMARGGAMGWDIYIGDDGSVYMEQPDAPARAEELPQEWLVGRYNNKTPCAMIEEDIGERIAEIREREAA